MKKHTFHLLALAVVFLFSVNGYSQTAEVQPKKVSGKPGPELFTYSPIGKPDKFSKEFPVVITQFNVLIKNEQEIYAATGGAKRGPDDAQLQLFYRLKNLDNAAFQKATDELADYMAEKFNAAGYKTIPYSDFAATGKYPDISKKNSPRGEKAEDFGPGNSVPALTAGKYGCKTPVMFTAHGNPYYSTTGMKPGAILMEKKWNGVNFGLVLNIVEWTAKASSSSTQNKVSVQVNPAIYGFSDMYAMGPMMGGFSLNNTTKETPNGFASAANGYFTDFNKDSGDITLDNDKFITAYKEYGRQIIDGFFDKMANPGGK